MNCRIRFSPFYAYCVCAAEISHAGTTVTFLRPCGVTAIAIFCHSSRWCRSGWRSSNPAFILIFIFCLPLSRGLMTGRLRALLPCSVPRLGFPHGSGSCFRTWRFVRYLAIGRFAVKPVTGARRSRDRRRRFWCRSSLSCALRLLSEVLLCDLRFEHTEDQVLGGSGCLRIAE